MIEIMDYLKARYMSEKAQGLVEYALIIAFVALIAVAAFKGGLSEAVSGAFGKATNAVNTAN